jgi:hypothetical protein
MSIELQSGEKAMSDDRMTKAEFLASRIAAGQVIDIETCEVRIWSAYTIDTYGIEPDLPAEARQIGSYYFVRSAESDGWVCQYDLPQAKVRALYARIERADVDPMGDMPS